VTARSTHYLHDRFIVESFAGLGGSRDEAIHNAFDKFCRASLHVLLAAFVDRHLGADQVEWEHWANPRNSWNVCLGPLLTVSKGAPHPPYGGLLDQLKETFLSDATPEAHWARVFRGASGPTV